MSISNGVGVGAAAVAAIVDAASHVAHSGQVLASWQEHNTEQTVYKFSSCNLQVIQPERPQVDKWSGRFR